MHENIALVSLTAQERKQVSGWFIDTEHSIKEENQAAKKVFDLVLGKLLASHPQAAAAVEKVSREASYEEPSRGTPHRLNGVYKTESKKIQLNIHPDYQGSILDYSVRLHENYHALEDRLLEKLGVSHSLMLTDAKKPTKEQQEYRYLAEVGAIMAEWLYLNAIPPEIRARWIQRIKLDPNLNAEDKKTQIRNLMNSSLDQLTYLELEHRAGRYSYEGLVGSEGKRKLAQAIAAISLSGSSIGAYLAIKECNKLTKNSTLLKSDKEYIEKICRPLGFIVPQ